MAVKKDKDDEDSRLLGPEDLDRLKKEFIRDYKGKIYLGDDSSLTIKMLPLNIASLDYAIAGGFAFNRIIGLFGQESSGKTLLAMQAIKQAQALGHMCAFVDVEKTWTPEWAEKLGIRSKEVMVVQPDNGEHACNMMLGLVRERVPVIVFDSLAALTTTEQLEMDPNEIHQKKWVGGDTAKMIGAHLKLVTAVNRGSCCIYINQLRKSPTPYGDPNVMPGGESFQYYCWQLIRVIRGKDIEEEGIPVGYNLEIYVKKNKQGTPHLRAAVPFMFSGEFDELSPLVEVCVKLNVLEKNGGSYTFLHAMKDTGELVERKIFGRPKLMEALRTDEVFLRALEEAKEAYDMEQ